jgi:hypothetical protein
MVVGTEEPNEWRETACHHGQHIQSLEFLDY